MKLIKTAQKKWENRHEVFTEQIKGSVCWRQ